MVASKALGVATSNHVTLQGSNHLVKSAASGIPVLSNHMATAVCAGLKVSPLVQDKTGDPLNSCSDGVLQMDGGNGCLDGKVQFEVQSGTVMGKDLCGNKENDASNGIAEQPAPKKIKPDDQNSGVPWSCHWDGCAL